MGEEAGRLLDLHRAALGRLAYQLTGDPGEAEDVVQETFLRALERWPPVAAPKLRAWLVRVATNLGIDALRRRRRSPYVGPWLPVPVAADRLEELASTPAASDVYAEPEARYALRESVSYAFLTALEVLTPRQRSVLLLRDVLGYSGRETADALATSEESVRIAHHRARRAVADYDEHHHTSTSELSAATSLALGEFLACLRSGDAAGLEKLIAESAVVITDGGGEYNASRVPLRGRERAIRFHIRIAKRRGPYAVPEPCSVNGLPAALVRFHDGKKGAAPVGLLRCDVGTDGLIRAIHWILVPRKIERFTA
jgi:RNA polymerase sigma-70 factor (ECF subfamily)